MNDKAGAIILAILLMGSICSAALPVVSSNAQGGYFTVVGAQWGTSASPAQVGPGDQGVTLTVSMIYTFNATLTYGSFELELPSGFTALDGSSSATSYQVNLQPDTPFTLTYTLNVNSTAVLGSYSFPINAVFDTKSYSDLYEYLTVPVSLLGTAELSFSSNASVLTAGVVNNLTVTLLNEGSGNASAIELGVSSSSQVSILNGLSSVVLLTPSSSTSQVLRVYVSSGAVGSPLSLQFTATYKDAYLNTRTIGQSLGYYVQSLPQTASSAPFQLVGAQWGSSSTSSAVQPGDSNVQLTANLLYLGNAAATGVEGFLHLPSQFSSSYGQSVAVAYASSVESNQAFQLAFDLDIASTAALGSYSIPLEITWSSLGVSNLSQDLTLSVGVSGRGELSVQTTVQDVDPGQVNSVRLVLNNTGTGAVSSVSVSVSAPSQASVLSSALTLASLQAGASVPFDLSMYISSQAASSPLSLVFSMSYVDTNGVSKTTTETVGVYVTSSKSTVSDFPLSVTSVQTHVTAGETSSVAFTVTDEGNVTLYSPSLTLTVQSPLVVSSGFSANPSSSAIRAGQSQTYTASLSSGPSSTAGIYSGTITVSFTDQNGDQLSESFPVAFTLMGRVSLVVQDLTVAQTTSNLTISGSILNEGNADIYYAQVSGAVASSPSLSGASYYMGEVDTNTPIPFTISIPFTTEENTPQKENVLLNVTYQDSFGATNETIVSAAVTLKTLSQLVSSESSTTTTPSTSSEQNLINIVEYAVVIAIAAAAVIGVIFVRRQRREERSSGGEAAGPKGENKVI
jgi:hypothetical protein